VLAVWNLFKFVPRVTGKEFVGRGFFRGNDCLRAAAQSEK
jgi:hypothetical protein